MLLDLLNALPQVVAGTAALTGTGTLSGTATVATGGGPHPVHIPRWEPQRQVRIVHASANLAAAGTLTAAATVTHKVSVHLTGVARLGVFDQQTHDLETLLLVGAFD